MTNMISTLREKLLVLLLIAWLWLGSSHVRHNIQRFLEGGGPLVEDSMAGSVFLKENTHTDGCDLRKERQADWTKSEGAELNWLRDVNACTKQFQLADIKFFGGFDENIRTLQCQLQVDMNLTRETLSEYNNLWFFGDSLLIQQFYALICMFNPDVTRTDLKYYKPTYMGSADDFINAEYIHNNSTRFLFSRFGYTWAKEENNLYKYAFPKAVQSLTKNDAIILDGSYHYDSTRLALMERAMTFIKQKSYIANASMFYIEASPEEWPTSNGLYAQGCYKKCTCQALNPDQIIGQWNHSHVQHISRKDDDRLPLPNIESFEKYLGKIDYPENSTEKCFPDCLPASWKSTVTRNILADANINIVPVFWQLVDKGTPTNARFGDCTHKSQEGITMMNQQLIRTMIGSQAKTAV